MVRTRIRFPVADSASCPPLAAADHSKFVSVKVVRPSSHYSTCVSLLMRKLRVNGAINRSHGSLSKQPASLTFVCGLSQYPGETTLWENPPPQRSLSRKSHFKRLLSGRIVHTGRSPHTGVLFTINQSLTGRILPSTVHYSDDLVSKVTIMEESFTLTDILPRGIVYKQHHFLAKSSPQPLVIQNI